MIHRERMSVEVLIFSSIYNKSIYSEYSLKTINRHFPFMAFLFTEIHHITFRTEFSF